MNKTTIVIVTSFTVVAALAAYAYVPRSHAQLVAGLGGACCLDSGGCVDISNEVACNQVGGVWLGSNTTCVGSTCPTAPTVVSVSVSKDKFHASEVVRTYRVFRSWSDGQTDMTLVTFSDTGDGCAISNQCGPTVLIPGTCPTDINRDGDTGIQDFLTLLGGWGACR